VGLLALILKPELEGHLTIEAPLAVVAVGVVGVVAPQRRLLTEEQPDGRARPLRRTRLLSLGRCLAAPGRLGRSFSGVGSSGRTLEAIRRGFRGRGVRSAFLQCWRRLLKYFEKLQLVKKL